MVLIDGFIFQWPSSLGDASIRAGTTRNNNGLYGFILKVVSQFFPCNLWGMNMCVNQVLESLLLLSGYLIHYRITHGNMWGIEYHQLIPRT